MIEIPESHTLARQLTETICERKILKVLAGYSPHAFAWFTGHPKSYASLLEGTTITDARAIAGWVEITAGNVRLLLNDGVNVRFINKRVKTPAKHQLYIELDDGDRLVCSVQMYGGIYLHTQEPMDNPYYSAARMKPSPLSNAFTPAYFETLVQSCSPKLSVKTVLATEQRIPGLGNGCLQDILFNARIHPMRKLESLDTRHCNALYASIRSTLDTMPRAGGRDTEKDLFGAPGGYTTLLSKKTLKNPCPLCGEMIARKPYLGGNVYFCPQCQPTE